jgi:predicted translin family RNA/ssDNA-binding protein
MTIRDHLDQALQDLFQARERAIQFQLSKEIISELGTLYRAVTRMKMKIEDIHEKIEKEKVKVLKTAGWDETRRSN